MYFQAEPLIKATETASYSSLSKLPKIIEDLRRQMSDVMFATRDNQKKAKVFYKHKNSRSGCSVSLLALYFHAD